mgnify:CR=1 FL=1
MSAWAELSDTLDMVAAGGRAASFWLRDDDAVRVTPPLERLGALISRAKIPLVLATIPALAEEDLPAWTRSHPDMRAAVHGYAHANHAPAGEKRQELGHHRPLDAVLAELVSGLERTKSLFGSQALPMLVPPWNRIAPTVADALPRAGFRLLSAFGQEARRIEGLSVLNTHVDLIDWRGGRGCRAHDALISEIVALLGSTSPIGVLTHHLVHDEDAWTFLSRLFEVTRGRARWVAPE